MSILPEPITVEDADTHQQVTIHRYDSLFVSAIVIVALSGVTFVLALIYFIACLIAGEVPTWSVLISLVSLVITLSAVWMIRGSQRVSPDQPLISRPLKYTT